MIARTRPSSVPRAMLATVRKIVSISPRRIDSWVKYLATTSHLKLGLVDTETRMPEAEQDAHDPGDVLEARSDAGAVGLSAGSIPLIVGSLPWVVSCTMVSP